MAADRVIDELVCSAPTYKISNCVSKLWPLGLTCCCWWDYYYDNYYCWYYSYYLPSGLLANLCILALLLEIWALIPVPVKCQFSTDIFLTLTRYSSGQSGMRWYILSAILLGIKCYFLKSYVKTSWRCVIYFCHCHKALSPSSLLMGQRLQFWIIFICPCWNLAFQNKTERVLVLN